VVQTVRQLGGTLGIAVIGSVVLLLSPHHHDRVGAAEVAVSGPPGPRAGAPGASGTGPGSPVR
jgi:hypothetical protein